jgi:hypothetical protein
MTTRLHLGREVPIEFHVPDTIASRYATNMQVMHTEHEFILSFFETQVPALPPDKDKMDEELSQISTVKAECVARVTVAATRMEGFVKVLQQNLEHYKSMLEDTEQGDE